MKQSTHKKKISFAMQSLFEGKHHITYFDSEGNPIRTAKPKQQKKIHSSHQTSLL